jgi:RNA polymerase-binding transcription factor DksA
MARKTTPAVERFTRFYFVDRSTGCWVWIGGNNGRYPTFGISRSKNVYAHRFSYENFIGQIPKRLEVDHQCNNKLCVNPDHLKAMTHRENQRRKMTNYCHLGHPFDKANTWVEKNGQRHCRACHREIEAARRERLKNAGFRL